MRTRSSYEYSTTMAALPQVHDLSGEELTDLSSSFAARGVDLIVRRENELFTYNNANKAADVLTRRNPGATLPFRHLPPGVTPAQAQTQDRVLATIARLEQASAPDTSSGVEVQILTPPSSPELDELDEMAGQEDGGIPMVKFPPKPEGWKGDPGNPNFKALGTLSPPVMRKIEPAGPHFLAFARRVSLLSWISLYMLTSHRNVMAALSPKTNAFKHRRRSKRSRKISLMKSANPKTH
jgi:hypothetical protein